MKFKDFLMMLFEAEDAGIEGGNGNNGGNDGAGNNGGNDGSGNNEPEKRYTDADVDAMKIRWKAEAKKQQQKAVDEATKLANMTAQERAEAERDEWEKKYNELLAKNTRAELTVQARSMLSDANVSGVSDELIAMLVTEDAETTKTNVQKFTKMFKDAVQNGIRDLNKKPSPKAGGTSSISKADIMKIKDVTERQRLIREHMDLFK